MEALFLPFMFTSIIGLWIAIEWTLRSERRREAEQAEREEEERRAAVPR